MRKKPYLEKDTYYCSNPVADSCRECSLSNYGKDCQNNTIKTQIDFQENLPGIIRNFDESITKDLDEEAIQKAEQIEKKIETGGEI